MNSASANIPIRQGQQTYGVEDWMSEKCDQWRRRKEREEAFREGV